MAVASAPRASPAAGFRPEVSWALMFGNFVIACGVMAAPGTLNDMARSLKVSVSLAGQLIAIAAATMAFGAPLLAGWVPPSTAAACSPSPCSGTPSGTCCAR